MGQNVGTGGEMEKPRKDRTRGRPTEEEEAVINMSPTGRHSGECDVTSLGGEARRQDCWGGGGRRSRRAKNGA